MADPLSYQLLQAFEDCLERITVANGYHTNAGETVKLEPGQIRDDASEFVSVVFTGGKRPTDPALARTGREIAIAVVAKVPVTQADSELQLHRILEDVDRAMLNQQSRFPAGVDFPRYFATERIAPPEAVKWNGAIVYFVSNLRR